MIKNMTIELEVLPISELVLTDRSIWIWATDVTKSYANWDYIRVWHDEGKFFGGPKWSTNGSDCGATRDFPPPYTHYIILPNISC